MDSGYDRDLVLVLFLGLVGDRDLVLMVVLGLVGCLPGTNHPLVGREGGIDRKSVV